MTQLLLVGAGELGSRHLQGMSRVAADVVTVVEPSAEARARAETRYAEVATSASPRLRFVDEVASVDAVADVGVVATGSLPRRAVIEALVAHGVVPRALVLEKFLFPALDDYGFAADALAGSLVVVNTPRRRWGLYRALRATLRGQTFELRVDGTGWGLCCNAVHFVDAFSMLTHEALPALSFALGDVVAAKRPGYIEMMGSVSARAAGSSLLLRCDDGPVALGVSVVVGGVAHAVDERRGACEGLGIATAAPPFQSQDTGAVVRQLLEGADCGLPSLASSARLHRLLLAGFLDHHRRRFNKAAVACPIT